MSTDLNTTAAIIVLCLATVGSTPALASNCHDYHAWSRHSKAAFGNSNLGYADPVSLDWQKQSSIRPAVPKH